VSRTKLNSIDWHATRLLRAIGLGLLLFLIAAPAQANRIVQVRVGNHPTYTRLVFEMDAFAGYQVERRAGTDGTEQLTVTIEASTPPREITSKSVGIESVQIAAGDGQAIAQIQLRKSGLQMKEMILSNPPRIVLDFVYSAAAVAELTGDPYAKPTPAEPKPAIAKVVEPKPAPKPRVAKVVKPKPAPKLDPVPAPVEPTPSPLDAPVKPSIKEIAAIDSVQDSESSLAAEAERRADLRASIPGAHKRDKLQLPVDPAADLPSGESAGADQSADQIATAKDADVDAPLGSPKRASKPSTKKKKKKKTPSPSDVSRRVETSKPADSGLPFNTAALVGIAVGVLIVLVVAVRFFRKRSLPHDLDVTTFDDAPEDDAAVLDRETSDRIPVEGFSMDDSPADDPAPQVEEQNTAAYSLSEVAAEATEPETGLYDEDSEGEKPMRQRHVSARSGARGSHRKSRNSAG